MTKVFRIESYEKKYEQLWDDFVLNKSINGTFLQSRSFLNYHPEDRFEDCSLLIFNQKDNLAAVIPGCKDPKDSACFFSHKGSTYGGIVIDKKHYSGNSLLEIIEVFEQYLIENRYASVYLKITPDILSIESPALLEYLLYYKKYQQSSELNTYIDLENYDDHIVSNFSQGKRTNITNCLKTGVVCRQIHTSDEIQAIYTILVHNLRKYNAKPVHSFNEFMELKSVHIPDNISLFGGYIQDDLVAGSVVFYFPKTKTIHTQYLCSKEEFAKLSPMSFMYYSMIVEAKKINYKRISWGVSTEDFGHYLNQGLLKNKESYGSTYSINKTFYKMLTPKV
ncbi:GNAT family N-acetyltransferase [Treponema denticola]|uniref:GNAT family N-acetyltransferase n=1 Tax=Treponema denticola TaxID=158 RepID=UPI0020A5BF3E|nr:GNAT family N-acetyltransferase [Treponema denticola]UTD07646.1 GNAT family N-acetyltransferase [Treponema denticola]